MILLGCVWGEESSKELKVKSLFWPVHTASHECDEAIAIVMRRKRRIDCRPEKKLAINKQNKKTRLLFQFSRLSMKFFQVSPLLLGCVFSAHFSGLCKIEEETANSVWHGMLFWCVGDFTFPLILLIVCLHTTNMIWRYGIVSSHSRRIASSTSTT